MNHYENNYKVVTCEEFMKLTGLTEEDLEGDFQTHIKDILCIVLIDLMVYVGITTTGAVFQEQTEDDDIRIIKLPNLKAVLDYIANGK